MWWHIQPLAQGKYMHFHVSVSASEFHQVYQMRQMQKINIYHLINKSSDNNITSTVSWLSNQ